MVFSAVDNGINWLQSNYNLVVSLITLIVLGGGALVSGVNRGKSKKINNQMSLQNFNVGKIVVETLDKVVDKTQDLQETIITILDKINDVLKDNKDLKTIVILLLQTANIPLSQKQSFLKALNGNGEDSVKDALKSLDEAVREDLSTIKEETSKLDDGIEELKVLNK